LRSKGESLEREDGGEEKNVIACSAESEGGLGRQWRRPWEG
jgi:hypothetical protein